MTYEVSRSEFDALKNRYLGPEWPRDVTEPMPAEQAAEIHGVPVEELIEDLQQMRAQAATVAAAFPFRREFLFEKKMTGKGGVLAFAGMVGFCFLIFFILMQSINWFVPKGRNIQDRRPVYETQDPTKPQVIQQTPR